MTIVKNPRPSSTKSIPGLVETGPGFVRLLEQTVRLGGEDLLVPEMVVNVPPPARTTDYRVVLTREAVLLEETPVGDVSENIEGEVCYLAAFRLEPGQSPHDVDVEVPWVVLTLAKFQIDSTPRTPARSPDRVEREERRREHSAAVEAVRSKAPSTWTPQETARVLASVLREQGVPIPQDTEPKAGGRS